MREPNWEPSPDQRRAMTALTLALSLMYDQSFGCDGIAEVLESKFPDICNQMAKFSETYTWRRREDPYCPK
jgi:hypothetical protein